MTDPSKIFLFNSALSESLEMSDFLKGMGPSQDNVRGQNIGNGYIAYGFLKALFGCPVKVDHISNALEAKLSDQLAEEINQKYSHLVWTMKDDIREDFSGLPVERITHFLEKITIPIVPVSLCANSFNGYDPNLAERLSPNQKRNFSLLSEKSKLIGVRGNYSAEILNSLGIKNVRVIGCPSYFENGPTRALQKKPWDADKVITTATFFNSGLPRTSHLLQDELYFINLLYLEKALPSTRNITAQPFNLDEIPTSFQLLAKAMAGRLEFFPDYSRWATFFKSNDHCLTIGTRLHSGILSINSGVPAIVTNPDSRARETCEYLRIPYDPTIHSRSNIREVFENLDLSEMNNAYPVLYKEFLDFLDAAGLVPCTVPHDKPCFEFPDLKKSTSPSVAAELHEAYTELVENLDREVVVRREHGGEMSRRLVDKFQLLRRRYPGLTRKEYLDYLSRSTGKAK
ncbi:polysaccharide pyruvyl transferase family protein [Xanthomonas euvesicatoria]|uniref:polysaccharide pyruvyl transferase family protein n=1 Tax=Xanthomonas euvesicatoria TaxID=456327 RepID=UPI001C466772|nr:polysaccharide pyruvyl transferase family protein [Xanthomonas euvesicatoria]MBV6790433.1 polysaccharide pyruvyl transferase family protein [Xanthomonas campestris pv. clerodendri]